MSGATGIDPADLALARASDGGAAASGKRNFQRVGRGPQRRTRWDRPPEPKDWRFFVGWTGRVLIILGLLMFLFVGYQLWGTGIETARAQNQLENRWEQLLPDDAATTPPTAGPPTNTLPAEPETTVADTTPSSVPTDAAPSTAPPGTAPDPVPATDQNLPPVVRGEPLALLQIPRIEANYWIVPGVTHEALKDGPGHFPDTPMPGQLGNTAIAGHRTTYKAPFGNLDKLEPGDEIDVQMLNGQWYVYVVTGSQVVAPADYWVISDSDPARATMTLITCTPKGTSTHRLAVFAELDPTRSGPVGEATYYDPDYEPGSADGLAADDPAMVAPGTASSSVPPVSAPDATVPDASTPAVAAPNAATDPPAGNGGYLDTPVQLESDAFSEGWFHDQAAWPQIALWGVILLAIITAGWALARFFKREWVGALVAFAPFFACLYFFFQNVNRLLPPGL